MCEALARQPGFDFFHELTSTGAVTTVSTAKILKGAYSISVTRVFLSAADQFPRSFKRQIPAIHSEVNCFGPAGKEEVSIVASVLHERLIGVDTTTRLTVPIKGRQMKIAKSERKYRSIKERPTTQPKTHSVAGKALLCEQLESRQGLLVMHLISQP